MKKILVLALILLSGFSILGQSKKTKKPVKKKITTVQTQKAENQKTTISSPITEEEYAVFLTILGKDRKDFVVKDKTSVDDFGGDESFVKKMFKDLSSETSEDFKTKNKESENLEKKFPTKANYIIITHEELKKFFDKGLNWNGFYKQYPKSYGFSTFSRVGFSKDGKQALLFVAHSCGGLCGEGNYYLLKKENGEWKIIEKRMTWIS